MDEAERNMLKNEHGLCNTSKYKIRFSFDWQCPPFWAYDDITAQKFDYFIAPEELPLSKKLIEEAYALTTWHDTALNWDYPPDPSPWRQNECDQFNAAVIDFFKRAEAELINEFELIFAQQLKQEDPDLDNYLKDQKNFKRKKQVSIKDPPNSFLSIFRSEMKKQFIK
jgi:hypothetical protein